MNEVAAIRSGDERAFAKLYKQYHPKLYVYFYKKTGSAYLCEELVQLTFTKLWNSRCSLKEELEADIQLFRIARSSLIDLLRKEAAEKRRLQELANRISTQEAVYDPQVSRDAEEKLRGALDSLPLVRRKILLLSREHGFSYKEIADMLSLTPKAVENQIARALKQLRHFLLLLF